jgi:acetyl-CoA acetyltransferase
MSMTSARETMVIAGYGEADLGAVALSDLDLRAQATHRALADAGLTIADIDGVTAANDSPVEVAQYLGITPSWYDGTSVGGASFLIHVRHAVAAIQAGHCSTVLVTHGESGRSRIGTKPYARAKDSLNAQFEGTYGVTSPLNSFTLPALRYLTESGTTLEQLAEVVVAQSSWGEGNPSASRPTRVTVDDVLSAPMVVYPFTRLQCCVRTDGGGALIVTTEERARDLRARPVNILGSGEACDSQLVSQMADLTSSEAFRRSSAAAFAEARLGPNEIDHLMIYDAFAHLPLYGLVDLGFVEFGEAGAFIADGNTAPGGSLPMNTNGGGLRYTHTGMYGMFAIQESVRQLRGEAFRQVPGVEVSLVQGVGGSFTSAGTLILGS